MLQEYLKLNKNILIAFAASIIISAIIAQLLADQPDYLNTTYILQLLIMSSTFLYLVDYSILIIVENIVGIWQN